MKPYLRVLWNWIKLNYCGRKCSSLVIDGFQLLGWNTKLVFGSNSRVSLSKKVNSDGRLTVIVGENAQLTIGERVYFNERVMISCQNKVAIGDGCKFGPNVTVIDNNHCFDAERGVNNQLVSSPITIGKNCWIGSNVTIVKGTSIGDNCVISAGCVVKGNIPRSCIITQDRKLNVKPIE